MSVMSELDIDRQMDRIPKHQQLHRMCGTYAAARYLWHREYTLEQALDLLGLRRPVPRPISPAYPVDVMYCYDGHLPSLLRHQAGAPVGELVWGADRG